MTFTETQDRSRGIQIISFRRWTRKIFAVFNSLHKIIKICTLSLIYNIIVLPHSTNAQTASDSLQVKNHELGNVVISSGRTSVEFQIPARIVTVITRSEVERAPAQSVNDLIRHFPGVDLRQRGPFGAQADIGIRGGTFDQTLILLNGVNITDPQTGHHNLNLPLDIESIDRIEILQGPATKSFGPNAFSGAINIISGNSMPNHIRVSGMYGQYGLYKTSFNVSNKVGNLEHFLSVARLASDGYIKNTDLSNNNLYYQAKYKHKSGTIDFQTGYNSKNFGANSFYSLKFPGQFEATRTEFVSLKYESNTKIIFTPLLYLRRNSDRFELKRNNDSIPFNHHRTTTAGLNLNIRVSNLLGRTSLSFDFRNENILSTVLGDNLNFPVGIKGFENKFYTKYYSRLGSSVYAEQTVYLGKLTITAGLMAHHNSDLKGIAIDPGIDINYRFKENFRLYSSVNKTLRMPTFTDMFYKSPVQMGNPHLIPEEAVTIEGGIKYNSSILRGNLSVFRRWGSDMIDWVKNPSPDSIIWRSRNYTQINFTGLECSFTLSPPKGTSLERIKSIRLSYSFLKADSNRYNLLSKYALDYPANQVTVGYDISLVSKLSNSGRLSFNDRNGFYQNAMGQVVPYKSFWLCDTKLYWKDDYFTIYAEASNILNTGYYDFGGVIQPGLWVRAGIVVDLDYTRSHASGGIQ